MLSLAVLANFSLMIQAIISISTPPLQPVTLALLFVTLGVDPGSAKITVDINMRGYLHEK